MKSISIRVMLVSVALGAAILALGGTARASHVLAEIVVPPQATVGDAVDVQVTLRSADEGLPVADTPVVFYTEASFGGVTREVELGRAVTDENGMAVLSYQLRSAGDHEIRVQYSPSGDSEPQVATTAISVTGTSQLYQSTAGIQVPGLNVWLLIALVAGVWAILFGVALRVVAIARAGGDAETVLESAPRPGHAETQAIASQSGTSEAG